MNRKIKIPRAIAGGVLISLVGLGSASASVALQHDHVRHQPTATQIIVKYEISKAHSFSSDTTLKETIEHYKLPILKGSL